MMALLGDGEKQKVGPRGMRQVTGDNSLELHPALASSAHLFFLLSPLPGEEIPPSWALTAIMFRFIMGPETDPVTME